MLHCVFKIWPRKLRLLFMPNVYAKRTLTWTNWRHATSRQRKAAERTTKRSGITQSRNVAALEWIWSRLALPRETTKAGTTVQPTNKLQALSLWVSRYTNKHKSVCCCIMTSLGLLTWGQIGNINSASYAEVAWLVGVWLHAVVREGLRYLQTGWMNWSYASLAFQEVFERNSEKMKTKFWDTRREPRFATLTWKTYWEKMNPSPRSFL